MHTYKVVQQKENGAFILNKDGHQCECPKTAVGVPVQTNQFGPQQISFLPIRTPCNTSCPFATIEATIIGGTTNKDDADTAVAKSEYVIKCEGGSFYQAGIRLLLDEIKPFPKQEEK